MILIPTNPLATPLVLLIWAMDAYLVLVAFRLLFGLFAGNPPQYRFPTLERVVEGPVRILADRLLRWRGRPVATWLPWCLVVGTALAIRHLLIVMLLRVPA